MAEVVAAVAQPACEFGRCLWVPIAKRINYAKNLSKNWENLCKKTSELGTRRDDIDAKIELVKTQKTPTKECEEWKKNIEEMEKEIQTRRPEFEDEKKCLRGLCPNIFARIELGGRVVNMIYDVEKLLEKSKFENGFLTDSPPPNVEKKSIPDSLTTSSFNTMEKILDKIREETTPKIGIWGMGGIGKTTVMQLLNNTPEITTMFNFVIWVTVSKSWNIGKIQEEVGKRLSIDTTNESNERVASKLLQKLEGKKYLLLLDDVWQEVDLNVVGFPNANKENGCKVVLTTRKLEVCRKMKTDYEIKVGGLPEKEAWEIFNLRVGNVAKSPTIRQYAEEIAKKCGGLPLALKVVGGALRKKNNENVWRQFLKDLKSPAKALIEDVNVEVFKSLKVSYDYLTDIEQKNCLLFCGLYPEDKEIEKSTLIGYWRADGLLSGKLTLTDARVKGDVILEDLIDASLLEKCDRDDDNDYVKMHDVIRDLVLGMTSPEGEECIHMVRSGTSAETMPEDEEWEKATRISFMDNQHLSNLSKSPDCPMLLTLLLRGCHNLKVIPESFFDNMRRLHVLDLSRTGINSLPVSISKLIVLRELLLNDCLNLKVLPVELSELKSLEVFEVTKAKLDRLHLWIFELTNLKRLKIKDMRKSDDSFVDSEQVLVPGLISKTSQMEEFCVPNFFKDFGISDKSEDIVASELSSFSSLSSLDINFLSVSNLQYFLRNSRSWRERKLTEFRFCISPREMICGSQRYKKCLTYEGGRGEDHSILPWAIEDVLSRSNAFNLMDHGELTTLSDLGAQNTYELKFCHVDYCDMLENVVNGNGLEMDAFGNLEILELISLRNLKWILEMEGPPPPLSLVANSFTNLTKLYLCECPMIKHVFSNGFMIQQLSNLAMLVIRHCYGLEGMLSEDENIEYEALPKLKEVQLCVLPKFVSFFKGVAMCWKSLELVEISCCSKLRKLPLNVNSGTNLKRIQVTNRKFWDALEWDNNATKLRFQPLVIDLIWSHLFPTH